LYGAELQGANLKQAYLYGANLMETNTKMIDIRGLTWKPLTEDKITDLGKTVFASIIGAWRVSMAMRCLQNAAKLNAPLPHLQSCLATKKLPLPCDKRYDPNNPKELAEFKHQLYLLLADLTADSPEIARGIVRQAFQVRFDEPPLRPGLATVLVKRLDAGNAPGLQALSKEEKAALRGQAKKEQKWLK